MKANLVPFQRPDAAVIALNRKPRKITMAKTLLPFAGTSEDINSKPQGVKHLWNIVEKMDRDGVLVSDSGLIVLHGDGPDERRPGTLGLTKAEIASLKPFSVYDSDHPDDRMSARAVVVTIYQLLEAAYFAGYTSAEAAKEEHDSEEEIPDLDLENHTSSADDSL